MFGIDISGYQSTIDLTKGNYEFCIVKATEGQSFSSLYFYTFISKLLEMNKLIGAYHFARPDLSNSEEAMVKEAEHFVRTCESAKIIGKAILVLDWETEPMDREDLVTAWVEEVKRLTGITPFIYGSTSKIKKWKNWDVISKCPLWVAQWPTITPQQMNVPPQKVLTKDEINWTIWQYSSKGLYPGYSGSVDLNYTSLTKNEWLKLANGKLEYSESFKWAIDVGLFVGDGQGNYFPNEYMTRDQCAIVMKKLYEILNN